MFLPNLTELATHKDTVDVFAGYNHNLRIGDGEFYDMKNLTSSYYPVLSPRGKRGVYVDDNNYKPETPQGMIAKDALCYIDGSCFCMNEYRIDMGLTDSYKTLVSMGAYVIIMPDKKYINTLDLTDFGEIEAVYPGVEGQTVTATYEMCKVDGTIYTDVIKSPTPPVSYDEEGKEIEPDNLQLWLDTSSTPHSLKQYSTTSSMWTSIATTYIKISAPGIASAFKKFDAVKISGFPAEVSQLKGLEGNTFPLWEVYHNDEDITKDYIVVVGLLDETVTYETNLRIERLMPEMDFIIESNNRLWGCRYGEANNGKVVNEIYASKLGDFKNWNCFMGVSTDSYAASVGTDGQFTGAVTHLGYPIFFKENCLHKVYGNYPANYQIQTTACRGVQKGSEKSLAIVNEVLYYKSQNGICAYDGSLPNEISAEFGEKRYSGAVAAAHGNKYYVSMKDKSNKSALFVYDASKGMWHKEDDLEVKEFCSCRNELYYISGGEIGTMFGSGTVLNTPISWMAESGVMTAGSPDKKYISGMSIRMALDIGTKVYFYIQYDSMGEWEHVSTMTGSTLRTFTVPIKPKRCDHFRLRIVGEGDAKIYSMTKTIENGSDV